MSERLKLRARDAGDLETIAACIQDALVPLVDMKYLPKEHRFALMLNRFCWEAMPPSGQPGEAAMGGTATGADSDDVSFAGRDPAVFERVHAVLTFDGVRGVKRRGLEQAAQAGLLELLTLSTDGRWLLIAFAGGGALRFDVDQISCHLEDIGEPWPTIWRPQHGHGGSGLGEDPTDGTA
jgi:hypothetical protein